MYNIYTYIQYIYIYTIYIYRERELPFGNQTWLAGESLNQMEVLGKIIEQAMMDFQQAMFDHQVGYV